MDNPAEVLLAALKLWAQRSADYEANRVPASYIDVREIGSPECTRELLELTDALASIESRLTDMRSERGRETPYDQHFQAWTKAVLGPSAPWGEFYRQQSVISTAAYSSLEQLAFHWESQARTQQMAGIRPRDVDALRILLEEVEQLCAENIFLPRDVIEAVRGRASLVREEWDNLDNNRPHKLSAAVRDLLVVMILASEMSKENDPGWRAKAKKFASSVTVGGIGGVVTDGIQWVTGLGLPELQ